MLFYSCLVDADFLDTDAFYRRIEKHPARDLTYPSIDELKNRFDAYMAQPKFQSDKGINKTRKQILTTVREHAGLAPGLFTLNVPTGGGKTLSSLAFALDHAKNTIYAESFWSSHLPVSLSKMLQYGVRHFLSKRGRPHCWSTTVRLMQTP